MNAFVNVQRLTRLLSTAALMIAAGGGAEASEKKITYNLAPHTISAPITPAANAPVMVMGVRTAPGLGRGVGQLTLMHIPGTALQWAGYDYGTFTYNGYPVAGYSNAYSAHMLSLDSVGYVELIVNDGDSFVVRNNSPDTVATGQLTLIW